MVDDCLKCGICYQSCFLNNLGLTSFVSYSFKDDIEGLWTCCNCWTCQDNCPENIPLMVLKWQLQRSEEAPPRLLEAFTHIQACGYCLPVDSEDTNSFRMDIGLDSITLAPNTIVATLLEGKN